MRVFIRVAEILLPPNSGTAMMRSFLQNFTGAIIAAFVLTISFIVFALYLVGRSTIEPNVIQYSDNVEDTAKIYRDKFGIPHIIAESESDMFFTLGYVHAQDRLWQMDAARRTGRGTLSEVFGEKTVETDQFMRYIGLPAVASEILKHASPATRSVLHAYTQGVNHYIQTHKRALPFEFGALQYEPEPWTSEDCLIILRLTALEMSASFWADIALGDIADNIGVEKTLQLIPAYPADAPSIVGDKLPASVPLRSPVAADSLPRRTESVHSASIRYMLASVSETFSSARSNLGLEGSAIGSNCWVMKKSAQPYAGTTLACDPHLPLALPARWHQAHITSQYWNVVGLFVPGIPLAFSGRNDATAWGYSAMMLDDADFFIEKIDPKNSNYYYDADGKRLKFRYARDTITVRRGEPIIYDIRYTKRSGVISDVHFLKNQRKFLQSPYVPKSNAFLERYCLTYSWTGSYPTDELLGLYRINKAETWFQFTDGANEWSVPGMNFTYCDRIGTIGVAPSGAVPVRQKCLPNLPNPAWLPGYAWKGTQPPSDLPRIVNPKRRFIASANNIVSHNISIFISALWEPPSRAERLEYLLGQFDEYDIRDAQFMQMDATAPLARQVNDIAMRVLEAKKRFLSPDDRAALAIMKKWDGMMSPRAAEPALFAVFFDELLRHTFADELGDRLYRQYMLVSSLPTRKTAELLADSAAVWFDNISTKEREDRNEIIFRSFVAAQRRLKKLYDGVPFAEHQFGRIHQLTLYHQFSDNPYIRPFVTQGPMPSGGSNVTINCGEWRFNEPFNQVVGASMRFIADMDDSVAYSIVPGGASGEPLSAHYSDQIQLWLNGGYVAMPAGRRPAGNIILYETILPVKPKQTKW
ncbi:MAG: penicillin acylase family protein [Bacteroidetes bacterium]|nr:penicillin acylase family protein [Bacteroidota bacterium]